MAAMHQVQVSGQRKLANDDLIGADIAQHIAHLFIQQIHIQIAVRQPLGQVLQPGQFKVNPFSVNLPHEVGFSNPAPAHHCHHFGLARCQRIL